MWRMTGSSKIESRGPWGKDAILTHASASAECAETRVRSEKGASSPRNPVLSKEGEMRIALAVLLGMVATCHLALGQRPDDISLSSAPRLESSGPAQRLAVPQA